VIEGCAPHETNQHRRPEITVHLPEDPGLGAAIESPGQAAGDALPPGQDNLLLAEEQPRLTLLHQPEEGQVAGEGLDDGLDHPGKRDRRRQILGLDPLQPPDEEVERLGDDPQVEVLLGREIAVERALADPGHLRHVFHADDVIGAGGEHARGRPHDLLALGHLARRRSRCLHALGSRSSRAPSTAVVGGVMELTGQSAAL
jgi:hypothetical protein